MLTQSTDDALPLLLIEIIKRLKQLEAFLLYENLQLCSHAVSMPINCEA